MTAGGPGIGGGRRGWAAAARVGGGVAVLVTLVAVVGVAPFRDGLRLTSPSALAAALAITFVTTVCSAWRWRLVARALGVDLPLGQAVGACYRSQFLNCTLPGGVLGDVQRGLVHGRHTGSVARSMRSVLWERATGQVVLATLSVLALVLLPSPLRAAFPEWGLPAWGPAALGLVAALGLGVALLLRAGRPDLARWPARVAAAVREDVRLLSRGGCAAGVLLSSVAATVGYVAMVAVAVHTVGAELPLAHLVPLALVVLVAAAVPANLAGWGPREGAAAWAFGAAGLGAATGVSVAVAYGVMTLVAAAPGAVLLVRGRRRTAATMPVEPRRGHPEAARG